jgi:hypothetical protein
MNTSPRKTRACTFDALDAQLKAAIRAHGTKFGLEDVEFDILMCCETISAHHKKGFLGGIQTTLSAVYVTPKWLVWADSSGPNDVVVGAAQLSEIHVRDDQATGQGLNISGRFTEGDGTGITFIMLEAESDGQKFRHVLHKALSNILK